MVIVTGFVARRTGAERLLARVLHERYPTATQVEREVYAGPRPTPLRRDRQHTGGKR